MSLRALVPLLSLVAWGVVASNAAEREFKQSFPVQPGCTLKVDSYRGVISITESDTPIEEVQVYLHMEIGADTEEEADRLREALQLEAKVENNVVTLRARNPRETRVRFVWDDKYQMDLTWRIIVPRQCHVDARNINGSITVGNLAGQIKARVDKGSISLKNIDGSVDAATQFGDVVVSRCSGAVKVRVLKGLIRTGSMFGPLDLKNTTGDVEVMAAYADIRASAEAGDAIVGFPKGRKGEAAVSSSGGSVRAKIEATSDCTVDAAAVFGTVESQHPLLITAGASGRRNLTGKLGDGGSPIMLRANGGCVRIVPADAFISAVGGY
jgi:hypothetical protein